MKVFSVYQTESKLDEIFEPNRFLALEHGFKYGLEVSSPTSKENYPQDLTLNSDE